MVRYIQVYTNNIASYSHTSYAGRSRSAPSSKTAIQNTGTLQPVTRVTSEDCFVAIVVAMTVSRMGAIIAFVFVESSSSYGQKASEKGE